jgi:hypothetical protein
MAAEFSQMLAHVTGGRRYCFVVMNYGEGYAFFERIRRLVAECAGLECIRADDIPTSASTIRDKVHLSIDNAALVIADVSDPRPNIYYEIGYAAACRKPMIALASEGKEIPSDLQGIETIRYSDSRAGWGRFEQELKRHLTVHADSSVSLLRAMIVPSDPSPSYVLASPKPPVQNSRFRFHPKEKRTFGDNLGIVGILGAFASVFGEHCAPELLSAQHAPELVLTWDANLFLIGSPKVNPHTRLLMAELQPGDRPVWRFERCPRDEGREDFEVILVGVHDNTPFRSSCLHELKAGEAALTDHGLVMRGPHPRHPSRMVTIMAGPHSLGTAAACLAATRSPLIREIAKRLEGKGDLTQRDRTMWALVQGKADEEGHMTPDGVNIVSAGF